MSEKSGPSSGPPSAETVALPTILPRRREDASLRRLVRLATYVLAFVAVVWHLYYAYTSPMDRLQHSNIHLGLLLAVFYLNAAEFGAADRRKRLANGVAAVALAAVVLSTTYVHINFWRWLEESRALLSYTPLDLVVGAVLIGLVTHATWKAYGKFLGLVVVVAFSYGLFGPFFPGVLYHSGISLERLIYMNSVSLDGVYGFLLGISATWIIIFILFAGIIEAYGGMAFIIEMGKKIGSRMSSGIVQVAVITSMFMGSITGSSAANVATTGSFTIPLMKENGMRGRIAAAIEAIASTGGQMLPPVMGSAAFIMADILGISFFEVIRGALVPALLFYLSLVVIVHLAAVKNGWVIDSKEEAQRLSARQETTVKEDVVEALPYLVPLGVLIYTLVILRYDPMSAGLYAILTLIGTALVRDLRLEGANKRTVARWGRQTVEGFKIGIVNMAPLTAVLASLGIVIRILTRSGFTQRFSLQMIALAGGIFVAVLVLSMLASIIFGMGMPTPAAYVVVATLTAPALVRLDVAPLTAHMFVFYFALLSTITPPVALSCAVGAGIADSSFGETCKETVRLGLFAFFIPFAFVMNPELIHWDGVWTAVTVGIISIGLVTLAVALVGYNTVNRISFPRRAGYFVVGMAVLLVPNNFVQVPAAVLAICWFVALNVRDRWTLGSAAAR